VEGVREEKGEGKGREVAPTMVAKSRRLCGLLSRAITMMNGMTTKAYRQTYRLRGGQTCVVCMDSRQSDAQSHTRTLSSPSVRQSVDCVLPAARYFTGIARGGPDLSLSDIVLSYSRLMDRRIP